jgi:hypothetical protein
MYPPKQQATDVQEGTVKKHLARKKLVVDRQTIRLLEAQDLGHVAGGRKNPTWGQCGTVLYTDVVCPF